MWAELPVLRLDRTWGAVGADTPVTPVQLGTQCGRRAQAHTHALLRLNVPQGHTCPHAYSLRLPHTQTHLPPRLCPNTPAYTDPQVVDMRLSWRDAWSFSFP